MSAWEASRLAPHAIFRPPRHGIYGEWAARVRDGVIGWGGRAWRFRSADEPARHIEFIEWKQGADGSSPVDTDDFAAVLRELDGAGSVISREEWEETA